MTRGEEIKTMTAESGWVSELVDERERCNTISFPEVIGPRGQQALCERHVGMDHELVRLVGALDTCCRLVAFDALPLTLLFIFGLFLKEICFFLLLSLPTLSVFYFLLHGNLREISRDLRAFSLLSRILACLKIVSKTFFYSTQQKNK